MCFSLIKCCSAVMLNKTQYSCLKRSTVTVNSLIKGFIDNLINCLYSCLTGN